MVQGIDRGNPLSTGELTELIKRIPALKQVLVLDTCAAGRLVERLIEKRDVPSSQVKALERLKDRTGMHVLVGCAADAVSYEATRYGQGVLTYSLLLGMRGAALREEEFVDVGLLFGFAADKVPELARDIGGIQRPVMATPKSGASFDVGQVTPDDQPRIPLAPARPLVLRTAFADEDKFDDLLGLGRQVDDLLRNGPPDARGPAPVFVDAREFPQAFRVAGRYRVEGTTVEVAVKVFHDRDQQASFTVSGRRDDLPGLAAATVQRLLPALQIMTEDQP